MGNGIWLVPYALFPILLFSVCPGFTAAKSVPGGAKSYILVMDSPPAYQVYPRTITPEVSNPGFKSKQAAEAATYTRRLKTEQRTLISKMQSLSPQVRIGRSFQKLINAVVVEMPPSMREQALSLPGVVSVVPNRRYTPFLTEPGQGMFINDAWALLGGGEQAGAGILIGILDTGVDVTHPMFADAGFLYPSGFPKGDSLQTNQKVIVARAFPPDFGDPGDTVPWDRDGHGTHVASIAAGNYQVSSPLGPLSGIAPSAYIGNYKVFTNNFAESSQIIAAIEQSVEDGCDVINLSLGDDVFTDPEHDIEAQVMRQAVNQGVVVVVANGNAGQKMTVGGSAQTEEVISVGSIRNSHASSSTSPEWLLLVDVYVNDSLVLEGIKANKGISDQPFKGPYLGAFLLQDIDLVDGGGYGGPLDGRLCENVQVSAPMKEWVLVQRGECFFSDKSRRVEDAGGTGVVFYDNSGDMGETQPSLEGYHVPNVLISKQDGVAIKELLLNNNNENVRIEIYGPPITDRSSIEGILSSFSSGGPAANYTLKPDVVAIGEGTYSATQNDFSESDLYSASGFSWLNGTSFSSPRVAGLAALLKSRYPDWPPSWIKSAIQLTANHHVPFYNNPSIVNSSIHFRGAGAVNAFDALEVDTIVSPVLLNFGTHINLPKDPVSRWITVVNTSNDLCSYQLETDASEEAFPVSFSPSAFTLNSGQKAEIALQIDLPGNLIEQEYEPIIYLNNQTTGKRYTIHAWISIVSAGVATGDVLFLDDDDQASYETYYQSILDELGVAYTYWDVDAKGAYPTKDYLHQFVTVIWTLGQRSFNSYTDKASINYALDFNQQHLFETDLAQYLLEGGALFLIGQDYLDDKESVAFSREILGVELLKRDEGAAQIKGMNGNPVGDQFDTVAMRYADDVDDFTDYLRPVRAEAQTAFYANGSSLRRIGITIETCQYRAVFLAFTLEMMERQGGMAIIRKALEWLPGKEPGARALVKVTPSLIDLQSDTPPFDLTLEGNGFSYVKGYRAYLDFLPLENIARLDCQSIRARVPADIQPGHYTLHLVTGDGSRFRLENAVHVVDVSSVPDWSIF
jgi:minor extracellular serine protease Vpr